MKHELAPESIIAHPKNGFIRMVLTEFGADQVDLAEKNIFRGVTLDTEKISKLSTILLGLLSPKWLLPLPFRRPRFPNLTQCQLRLPSIPF